MDVFQVYLLAKFKEITPDLYSLGSVIDFGGTKHNALTLLSLLSPLACTGNNMMKGTILRTL